MYIESCSQLTGVKRFFEALSRREKRNPLSDMSKACELLGLTVDDLNEARKSAMPTISIRQIGSVKYQNSLWEEVKGSCLYQKIIALEGIDWKMSCLWIEKGIMDNVPLRNAFAVQELQLVTKGHYTNSGVDRNCRLCHKTVETPAHILAECEHWLNSLITVRHDSVARNIYYYLNRFMDRPPIPHNRKVPSVVENKSDTCDRTLYWGFPYQSQQPLHHNRPDILLIDKMEKKALIVEVAVVDPRNIIRTEKIKRIRYEQCGDQVIDFRNYESAGNGWSVSKDLLASHQIQSVCLAVIVVGYCGEVSKHFGDEVMKVCNFIGCENKTNVARDIIERSQRSAVLGSNRIIKNHLIRSS